MNRRPINKIVVLGLGYVGAPLAWELQKHFSVTGYDINATRVAELQIFKDRTHELSEDALSSASWKLTSDVSCLSEADLIIVTVPTPVSAAHVPDLGAIESATVQISQHAKQGVTIVYESTVFPGVTENICVPLIEKNSPNLRHKLNFWVGYSPERINPGDKNHTLITSTKIVAGDTPETLELINQVYSTVTKTFKASNIKVAEAAKVLENTQRDVDIALMNEISNICDRVGIDTTDVIEAASTKWNFNRYYPGLVGGHCISVDPYYLTHLSEQLGYVPSLILAAREINESMPPQLAARTLKAMTRAKISNPRVTVLGITFKENVPDIRNSKTVDLVRELEGWGAEVQIVDPIANPHEVTHEYGIRLTPASQVKPSNVIVLAVAHEQFATGGWKEIEKYAADGQYVVTDIKCALNRDTKPTNAILIRA